MRAIVAREIGDADVLELREVPTPVPEPTEVLVRVRAAGVNPTDWKRRSGRSSYMNPFPAILGYDVAGVVEEVGAGVSWLRPGDEVLGMPRFPELPGAYAEYVAAPSRHFVRKPAGMSFEQAAGLPLAALTAWQGLVDAAGVSAGQRVLVHAAAGGVGHFAVQIARARGAHVIASASAAKHEFLRSLGAGEVIDYRSADFVEVLREQPVDVVFDPLGEENGLRSLSVLRDGGELVSILGMHEDTPARAAERGIRAAFTMVEPDQVGLLALVDLVQRGELRVEIDSVFPLEKAAEAHRRGETNTASGKIVLTV